MCGSMKNNFRLEIGEGIGERIAVAHVRKQRGDSAIEKSGIEEIGPSGWRQAVTTDSRAQQLQPGNQPSADKACMAGDQDPFPTIESCERMRHQRSQKMIAATRAVTRTLAIV